MKSQQGDTDKIGNATMSKTPETSVPAADTAAASVEDKKKNVQVSTSLPPETFAKLDEHRWTARVPNISALVRLAVDEYVTNHKL